MKTHPEAGLLCQALAGDLSRRLKLIGVLGRHGKTTTASLIASVLSVAGHTVGVYSPLGYFDGLELLWPPADRKLSGGILSDWVARMVENGCSHAVVAVPNRAEKRTWLSGAVYDAVCLTSSISAQPGKACQDENPQAQAALFDCLAPEGLAVLNADHQATPSYLAQLSAPALTVGMRRPAEITGIMVEQFVSEQTFLLVAGSDTIPVRTRMIGRRHVYYCLLAAATGLAYGVDLPTVVRGLEAVEQVPGRLERVECGQPFAVFVDAARRPGALRAALQTLREVVEGRLICVLGATGRISPTHWRRLIRIVRTGADAAAVAPAEFSRGSPRTSPLPGLPDLARDLPRESPDRDAVRFIPDRASAIRWAFSMAQPGDAVLLAGQGRAQDPACPHDLSNDYQFAQQCLREAAGNQTTGPIDAPS